LTFLDNLSIGLLSFWRASLIWDLVLIFGVFDFVSVFINELNYMGCK